MKRILKIVMIILTGIVIVGIILFCVKLNFENQISEFHGKTDFTYSKPFINNIEETSFLITEEGLINIKMGSRSLAGSLKFKITDYKGNEIISEIGRNNNINTNIKLSRGRYKVVLDFQKEVMACAVFSLSIPQESPGKYNPMVVLDSNRYSKVEKDEQSGFQCPYYMYVPKEIKNKYLLVAPNNTGFESDDDTVHEEETKMLIKNYSKYADELGVPLLVPTFPRWEKTSLIYTHALDRDSLITSIPQIKRTDIQLIAMIDDARSKLSEKNITVDKKVLIMGFSAAGMYSNRFTILHPERIQAAAIGSPGGWPIVPIKEYDNTKLRYPIGIDDVDKLLQNKVDMDELKKVPMYFYIGSNDTNDSVPYEDSYENEDKVIIFDKFGNTPIERWAFAEKVYKDVGCSAKFVIYPDVGHSLTKDMEVDILSFFNKNIK